MSAHAPTTPLDAAFQQHEGAIRGALCAALSPGRGLGDLALLIEEAGHQVHVHCSDRRSLLKRLARDRTLPWETQRECARRMGSAGLDELPVVLLTPRDVYFGISRMQVNGDVVRVS